MKPSQHLQKARDLIAPPGAWIQNDFAKDSDGFPEDPCNNAAVCFCAQGAIARATYDNFNDALNANGFLRRVLDRSVVEWDDNPLRTQDELIKAFDSGIAWARAEGL